jgi:wyosine [tRNA(Phe)-imidazoG37] synthetase (radical SAM superfamily)
MLTFGPVPSRRLGRSLGINNIPPKACSYSCVYCQVGPTPATEIEPRRFYLPERIIAAVGEHLAKLESKGEHADYLSFVPDGEPTLDLALGEAIAGLRRFGLPVAVISNGSLLFRPEVRERLRLADWVSVKIDAVDDATWRAVNRPHVGLDHSLVLVGIRAFAADFRGTLVTETMLVRGINDSVAEAERVGRFIAELAPAKSYLALPIRPTAAGGIEPPDEVALNCYFQTLRTYSAEVEILGGYEGDAFGSTGNLAQDLLAISAVHPLRESAVQTLVTGAGADWEVVERLVSEGRLVRTEHGGHRFYVRRIRHASAPQPCVVEDAAPPPGSSGGTAP